MSNKMKQLVFKTAKDLLRANNTVTTLEVKTEVRKRFPEYRWKQNTDPKTGVLGVSELMTELEQEGKFTYVDNGTYRVYSSILTPTVAVSGKKRKDTILGTNAAGGKISATKAQELMKNNKGHFFTAIFTKKDGTERRINCQYLKDQSTSNLGYVKVKEATLMKKLKEAGGDVSDLPSKSEIRSINLQTLTYLKIGGKLYKVN